MNSSIKLSHLSLLALLLSVLMNTRGYATETNPIPAPTQAEILAKKADSLEKAKKAVIPKSEAAAEKNEDNKRVMPPISEITIQIISVLFFIVMLFLLFYFFKHIKENHQHIGFQSIKLIGLILMFPGICIIALVGNGLINGTTLAALLGTIAGYVLSREDDSKKTDTNPELADLKKANDALTKEKENLKIEVDKLKAKLP